MEEKGAGVLEACKRERRGRDRENEKKERGRESCRRVIIALSPWLEKEIMTYGDTNKVC